jgi:hypothetical protein
MSDYFRIRSTANRAQYASQKALPRFCGVRFYAIQIIGEQ